MQDPIKKGATVRQVVPVVEGTVEDVKFDADTMSFSYLVSYMQDGESHSRWFKHAELADITPAVGEGA